MSPMVNGKSVGPIGFGLLGLHARPLSEDAQFAAIKTALEAGCNYFDGAEFYGIPDNNSLTTLCKYFDKYPEDAKKVVLNLKGAFRDHRAPDGSKEFVSASIENSVRMLGNVGYIDHFQAARKDLKHDYEDETLRTIESYVKAGKIGGISATEVNAKTIRSAAKRFNIVAVEVELSLFYTGPLTNGILETCGELDIPVIAYSPLGRGLLTGRFKSLDDLPQNDMKRAMPRYQPENFSKNLELVSQIESLAKKKSCTAGQIAINWVLSLSKRPGMPTIIPIPGSSNPDRIRENATIIDLTPEDLTEIDQILASFVPAGERYPTAYLKDLEL